MEIKKLKKGEVLWQQGEPASTIAFVDKGRLGIRAEEGLIGVVGPPSVIGESALLAEVGRLPNRRASVVAIEDSTVTEYEVSFVHEGHGAGLPRKILRSLIAQTVTSSCFILASHPDAPLVTQSMNALIHSLSNSNEMVSEVRDAARFSVDFAYLYALRDAIDGLRARTVPQRHFLSPSDSLLRASKALKSCVTDAELADFLDKFMQVEKERIEVATKAEPREGS